MLSCVGLSSRAPPSKRKTHAHTPSPWTNACHSAGTAANAITDLERNFRSSRGQLMLCVPSAGGSAAVVIGGLAPADADVVLATTTLLTDCNPGPDFFASSDAIDISIIGTRSNSGSNSGSSSRNRSSSSNAEKERRGGTMVKLLSATKKAMHNAAKTSKRERVGCPVSKRHSDPGVKAKPAEDTRRLCYARLYNGDIVVENNSSVSHACKRRRPARAPRVFSFKSRGLQRLWMHPTRKWAGEAGQKND